MGSRRPLIVLLVVAACGGGGSSSSPTAAVDRLLGALEAFQKRGCACKDAACFQAVQAEMEAWAKANGAEVAGAKATKAQGVRAAKIDQAMVECQEQFGVVTEAYKRADRLVYELRQYKERYCACLDPECVATVDEKMKLWAKARAAEIKQLKPTKKQDAAAAAVEAEIKACLLRAGVKKAPGAVTPP